MRHRHLLHWLAMYALLVGSARLQAADDVVSMIPDNALGYAVVKDMEKASGEIRKIVDRMQLPSTEVLELAKQTLNLRDGFDDTGDLAMALLPQDGGEAFPIILLRTKNYSRLIAQLEPKDEEGSIRRVTIGKEEVLVAPMSKYAIFTTPEFMDGLKRVLKSKRSVRPSKSQKQYTSEADAYIVVTNAAVKIAAEQGIVALDGLKQEMEQVEQLRLAAAGLGMYQELLEWVLEDVGQVILTAKMDAMVGVTLTTRIEIKDGKPLKSRASSVAVAQQLGALPKWQYVMAFSGDMINSDMMDFWMRLSMVMMKTWGGESELTDDQVKKLFDATLKTMKGMRSMSFTFGVPTEGGSIYSRTGGVIAVENSKQYIDRYAEATLEMAKLMKDLPYTVRSAKYLEVAGTRGMKIEMQIKLDALAQDNPQAKAMMEKLYGKDGKISIFLAPVNDKEIAMAYSSEEALREVMASLKSKERGLGTDNRIQKTAKLLSKDAQMVGFLSPQGTVQFVKWMMEIFVPPGQAVPPLPDFPEKALPMGFAVSFSGKSIDFEWVTPEESLVSLGEYIRMLQHLGQR